MTNKKINYHTPMLRSKLTTFFNKQVAQGITFYLMLFPTVSQLQASDLAYDPEGVWAEQCFLDYLDAEPIFAKSKQMLFPREDPSRERGEQSYAESQNVFFSLLESKPKEINFNINKLIPFDRRGTCSAMALDFLARYFYLEGKDPLQPPTSIRKEIAKFKPYYRANTSIFTSRQAAFNTIEIAPKYRTQSRQEKNKFNKIKSLALYHNITLTPATETIAMRQPGIKEKLAHVLDELPHAKYIIRMLSPNDTNEKMENFGHTMVLVKAYNSVVFFNNTKGAEAIYSDIGEEIAAHIVANLGYIPEIRFYTATIKRGAVKNISTETTTD